MTHYLRVWLASARYSLVRTMMFRGDFFLWSLVELFWISVNLLTIAVIYQHTDSVAGWNQHQMILLVGTSMLIQRLLMGFFWSSIFELGRNVRTGNFDFMLAQPGNVLFMASTRKLDPDGLINALVSGAVVVYAARQLQLEVSVAQIALYVGMIFCGVVIHYSILVLSMSFSFWLTNAQGLEGGYFTMVDFSRLPKQAFTGLITRVLLVWALPVVVVSNVPTSAFLHGLNPTWAVWLLACTIGWFSVAVFVFNRGLRRYSSASS